MRESESSFGEAETVAPGQRRDPPGSFTELLDERAIFVYGANEAGILGAGAAAEARRNYGARRGIGYGTNGRAFGIPTKDAELNVLPLKTIGEYVERFLEQARQQSYLIFQVTRIGCGLAGYSDAQIYPLFEGAPANALLPGTWDAALGRATTPRVIVAGSRGLDDTAAKARIYQALDRAREKIGHMEVVCGKAPGVDSIGEAWGKDRGVSVTAFPARWKRWDKPAGFRRNRQMAWYATHLIAFHDGRSPGTANMVETARNEQLKVWLPAIGHKM